MKQRMIQLNICFFIFFLFLFSNSVIQGINIEHQNTTSSITTNVSVYNNIVTVPTDFPSIQQAIDFVAPGDTIIVLPGIYKESIHIDKSLHLIGSGYNTTTIQGLPKNITVYISSADMVTIQDFTISHGDDAAIYMIDTKQCVIQRNRFINNTHGIRLFFTINITINENIFSNCGLGIYGDEKVNFYHHITDNTVNDHPLLYLTDSRKENLYAPLHDACNIILVNCSDMVLSQYEMIQSSEIGMELAYCTNITINSSRIYKSYFGLYLRNSYNINIQENEICQNEFGIHIRESSSVIKGNTIAQNTFGVYCWHSENNVFSHNIVKNNTNVGIFLFEQSNNNTIYNGNNITENVNGIDIHDSRQNHVEHNIINKNSYIGLFLKNANQNTIAGNIVLSNRLRGIGITQSSYNTIIENTIVSNKYYGLLFDDSDYNIINQNNVSNNQHGISLYRQNENNIISSNTVTMNRGDGIQLFSQSNNNTLTSNQIHLNFLNGLSLSNCNHNTIINCTISHHILSGIGLSGSHTNSIQSCELMQNFQGILLTSSFNCLIKGNNVHNNYWGIKLENSKTNNINQNNIVSNNIGIMRGIFNIISKNNFINNIAFDALGQLRHVNIWVRNYFDTHETIIPCYLYGLNMDILPKIHPYDNTLNSSVKTHLKLENLE